MWWGLLACGLGIGRATEPTEVVGDTRFWHPYPVHDVHVVDENSLLTVAGGALFRWSADGTLQAKVELDGCSESTLTDGVLSHDGQWVMASCTYVGESGVWRTSGGARVLEVDDVAGSTLCGGALWDYDHDAEAIVRVDLASGERSSHPAELRGGLICVADQWLMDEYTRRVDLDGTVTPLVDDARSSVDAAGVTAVGVVLARDDERLLRVHGDGRTEVGGPLPFPPDVLVAHGDQLLAVDDHDQAWAFDADGVLVGGPWVVESKGLSTRHGDGPVFVWGDEAWGWGGRRLYPLGTSTGALDTTYEQLLVDEDELYICHLRTCEAHRLGAPDAPPRTVVLPARFDDDTKISPNLRYLAVNDTRSLYRVELDTGEVQIQPVGEWVDGISIDDRGHFRWRLSKDEDDEGIYTTKVYEQQQGEAVQLGSWKEEWLSDPGPTVLQLGPTIRWSDGTKAGYDDADNWHENSAGQVFLMSGYGSRLEVFGPDGKRQASGRGGDWMTPWADGVAVIRGQRVHFLGPDLVERRQLDLPDEALDDDTVAAASPDGVWFATRAGDGLVRVFRTGKPAATPARPEPEPLASFVPNVRVGMTPTPDTVEVEPEPLCPVDYDACDGPQAQLLELGYTDDANDLAIVGMASFDPRTERERHALMAAIRRLPYDDDIYVLRSHWLAAQQGIPYEDHDYEKRWPDAAVLGKELEGRVKQRKLKRYVEVASAARKATPLPEGPAFGVEGCHAEREEPGMVPPTPPASAASERPRVLWDGILVRVAADGTPSWVGRWGGTNTERGRACWALHDGPWTPATKDGEPADMCVLVGCREAPTLED